MTWLDIIGYTYGILWHHMAIWLDFMDEHLGLILTFNGKSVVGNMMIKPVDGIVCLPNTRNIFRQNDAVWNHRWNCAQQVFVRERCERGAQRQGLVAGILRFIQHGGWEIPEPWLEVFRDYVIVTRGFSMWKMTLKWTLFSHPTHGSFPAISKNEMRLDYPLVN